MNELNVATFEASQRLFDAGAVLATENYWRIYGVDEDPVIELVTAEHRLDGWDRCNLRTYPAPSMAEVWRELPEVFEYESIQAYLSITKSRKKDNTTYAFYALPDDKAVCGSKKHSRNPADALIDLLIWVTEQKRKEKPGLDR